MMNENEKKEISEDLNDWIDALENQLLFNGHESTKMLISKLFSHAKNKDLIDLNELRLPFENTISFDEEEEYPGDLSLEEKIRHYIRWNALITVLKANKNDDLGGHISTYSSASILYEIGFNNFFKGNENGNLADLIYYQGHSSPGIYSRSFVEKRFDESKLRNFRREVYADGLYLTHPWLMPHYWQFPTVSMGLGPIMSIYQAHILKYLEKEACLASAMKKFLCSAEMVKWMNQNLWVQFH